MRENHFSKIFYTTIEKLSTNELTNLVPELSSFLINENKQLKENGYHKEYLEIFFYALATMSDHWILNHLIKDKHILDDLILEYSIEVKMFSTAEAGNKILEHARYLLEKDDEIALMLLGIYLKVLIMIGSQDKLLIQAIHAKVYPKQLNITDPFNCKTNLRTQNTLIKYLGIRSVLISSSIGYLLLSTCAWKYGTHQLKYSLLEQKRISLQNPDA